MANDIYNYSVMTNTGKGFITHVDSRAFSIQGFPADVWVATDCRESRCKSIVSIFNKKRL